MLWWYLVIQETNELLWDIFIGIMQLQEIITAVAAPIHLGQSKDLIYPT